MEIYKNGNRVTIVNGHTFVQVEQIRSINQFRVGVNEFIVNDCRKYDVLVTDNSDSSKQLIGEVLNVFETLLNELKENHKSL